MKKCLIIVDFQNDFVTGSLGFDKAIGLDEVISLKVKEAVNNNVDLIYTLDTHYDNYLETHEGRHLPLKHCIKGTLGHEVFNSTNKHLDKAKVFEKSTFGSLELGSYLKEQGYDEIELVGLVTNMCIVSNAIIAKSALPEANITIDSKAVMSFNDDLHLKSLEILEAMFFNIV